MRILVISDSHGNLPTVIKACDAAGTIDAVFHLGDGADVCAMLSHAYEIEVFNVAGNCDIGSASPRELILNCEGMKLLLVHGDAFGVKNGLGILEKRAGEAEVDAVLFGHTHRAQITTLSNGILAVNPGTLMRSSHHKSYVILELTPSGISARLHDIV